MRPLLIATIAAIICMATAPSAPTDRAVLDRIEETLDSFHGAALHQIVVESDDLPKVLKHRALAIKLGHHLTNFTRQARRKQDLSLGLQFLSLFAFTIYVTVIGICKCLQTCKERQEEQMQEAIARVEMKVIERQNLLEKQTKKRKQKFEAEGSMA